MSDVMVNDLRCQRIIIVEIVEVLRIVQVNREYVSIFVVFWNGCYVQSTDLLVCQPTEAVGR